MSEILEDCFDFLLNHRCCVAKTHGAIEMVGSDAAVENVNNVRRVAGREYLLNDQWITPIIDDRFQVL